MMGIANLAAIRTANSGILIGETYELLMLRSIDTGFSSNDIFGGPYTPETAPIGMNGSMLQFKSSISSSDGGTFQIQLTDPGQSIKILLQIEGFPEVYELYQIAAFQWRVSFNGGISEGPVSSEARNFMGERTDASETFKIGLLVVDL